MTVKELKNEIDKLLQKGEIREESLVLIYNERFDKSTPLKTVDDCELDENRNYCLGLNYENGY